MRMLPVGSIYSLVFFFSFSTNGLEPALVGLSSYGVSCFICFLLNLQFVLDTSLFCSPVSSCTSIGPIFFAFGQLRTSCLGQVR